MNQEQSQAERHHFPVVTVLNQQRTSGKASLVIGSMDLGQTSSSPELPQRFILKINNSQQHIEKKDYEAVGAVNFVPNYEVNWFIFRCVSWALDQFT